MLKVGLTGGIAAGKSVVGEMFVSLGAHLVQADAIAHDLMQPGTEVYEDVVRHFGKQVLRRDGNIDRARLADIAFGSSGTPSRITELNRIVHPAVIRKQDQWMEEVGRGDPTAIAMVEAALILEAGAAKRFDKLVVVTCQSEQRAQRWAKRTNADLESARIEVNRRMAAQLPDEEKIKAANFVINNSGSFDATRKQVQQVFERLRRLSLNVPKSR